MDNKKIELLLLKNLDLQQVHVKKDNNHIDIIAIGDVFKNISLVKRQQMIYSPLTNMIIEKSIHSISIKTYSLKEWKKTQLKINFKL